jgi:2'-5' RNA ligase
LTLARIQDPSCAEIENIQMALSSMTTWSADPLEVKTLTLFQSHLSPNGADYERLLDAALNGRHGRQV